MNRRRSHRYRLVAVFVFLGIVIGVVVALLGDWFSKI
jgi:hypothetical protein